MLVIWTTFIHCFLLYEFSRADQAQPRVARALFGHFKIRFNFKIRLKPNLHTGAFLLVVVFKFLFLVPNDFTSASNLRLSQWYGTFG